MDFRTTSKQFLEGEINSIDICNQIVNLPLIYTICSEDEILKVNFAIENNEDNIFSVCFFYSHLSIALNAFDKFKKEYDTPLKIKYCSNIKKALIELLDTKSDFFSIDGHIKDEKIEGFITNKNSLESIYSNFNC